MRTAQVVIGLAEQRVEKLLNKFAADRTVRDARCPGHDSHCMDGLPRRAWRVSWIVGGRAGPVLAAPCSLLCSDDRIVSGSPLRWQSPIWKC